MPQGGRRPGTRPLAHLFPFPRGQGRPRTPSPHTRGQAEAGASLSPLPPGAAGHHCAAGRLGRSRPRGDESRGSAGGPRGAPAAAALPSQERTGSGVRSVGTLRGCHAHMSRTRVSGRVSTGGAHKPFRDHVGKGDTSPRSRGQPRAVGSGGWQQGTRKADQLGPWVRAGSPGAGPTEPHPTLTPTHPGPRSGYLRVSFDLRLGQLMSPSWAHAPCCHKSPDSHQGWPHRYRALLVTLWG